MMRVHTTLLLALCLTGCAYKIRISAYPVHAGVSVPQFAAGAGKSEITPLPGIPLGGHGPEGRVARGYWTRLYARAFYFQDPQNHALALVTCDLYAVPAGLRAKVLELVNRSERLAPDDLIISANHTHHGPANFASAELYNAFAGPLPNFDLELFNFLADKISEAVVAAIRDAHAHSAEQQELRLYQGSAAGLQRNRAIAPFFANPENVRQPILAASRQAGAHCPDNSTENCPRYFAVDPSLNILQILRAGVPRALLIFYAVHPTAMTHDAELYSSDLAGVAMIELEKQRAPIAGFFNGAEGDVSPDWEFQDRDDVVSLARKLAGTAGELLDQQRFRSGAGLTLDVRWRRVPRDWHDASGQGFARKPMGGAATLGGAEDGYTIFYKYGWRAEARKPAPSGEHLNKEPALDGPLAGFLESLDHNTLAKTVRVIKPTHFLSLKMYPKEVPVATARFGSLFSLATVPVEATTAVGRSIREQVQVTAVIGLANEYFSYTTTAAEYNLQQYEAASTLLGPHEAETLVKLLGSVEASAAPPTVAAQTFRAGPRRKNAFGPETLLVRRPRHMVDEDLEPLIPRRLRRLESRIPRFEWTEDKKADWLTAARSVAIYTKAAGADTWLELENDRGVDFLTVLADGRTAQRRYAALWIPPQDPPAGGEYFFRVHTAADQLVCSQPFHLADLPAKAPVPPVPPADCPVQ